MIQMLLVFERKYRKIIRNGRMEIYNMYGPHFLPPNFRFRPIRPQNRPKQHFNGKRWRHRANGVGFVIARS